MSLHESQSRMWEHLVGSSLPFWEYFYPRLQGVYPSQLGSVSLEDFYKGYNLVQPSFIRIEADEATYNLHVMLRLELEIALTGRQPAGQGAARCLAGTHARIPGHYPAG